MISRTEMQIQNTIMNVCRVLGGDNLHKEILPGRPYEFSLVSEIPKLCKVPAKGLPTPCRLKFRYVGEPGSFMVVASLTNKDPTHSTAEFRAMGKPPSLTLPKPIRGR